ncbi:MAG: hypothetical protein J5752_03155 [Clostridiales bacterium]|nr:hypothetical protein [Clostridiales bacterium]
MFGDDLKKSLEPIQVSDELLEKTRKAIEAARLEQAKASLDTASKKSFSSGKWLRVGAFAACALLVGIGLFAVLPHISSGKKSDAGTNMKSAKNIYGDTSVAQYIDAELAEDNWDIAYETTAVKENDAAKTPDKDEMSYATSAAAIESMETQEEDESDWSNTFYFANKTIMNGKTIKVDLKHQKLSLDGNSDGASADSSSFAPLIPTLSAGEVIEGIASLPESSYFGIVISSPVSDAFPYGYCTLHLYKQDGQTWTETCTYSQSGKYCAAALSEGSANLYTAYTDNADAAKIEPSFKKGESDWEALASSKITMNNKNRGGVYSITGTIDLKTSETTTSALYS